MDERPDDRLTRRGLLIAGAGLLLAGCVRQPQADDAPAPAAPAGLWYTVQPGDTLMSIAQRAGMAPATIVRHNHLTTTTVAPGQRLWLEGVTSLAAASAAPVHDNAPKEALRPGRDYELVPRAAWAEAGVKGNNRPMGGVDKITIHHTGEHEGLVGLPDVEVIRRIERYHQNERHWAAIGYHYLVGRDGRIYEGRPVAYQGAHVLSGNEHNVGISVIGDFMHHLPSPRQLGALDAFLGDTRSRFGVSKSRTYGHRDIGKSLCPGDALYGWLQGYKRA